MATGGEVDITIIIMQCDCGVNVVLVMDTEKRKFMGYCPNCRTLYDMTNASLGDLDIAQMLVSARPLKAKGKDDPEGILFYLRCTGILG